MNKIPTEILEAVATKVHDTWAERKQAEGWIYGASLDLDSKRHPCLVPYDQLSESQKDYDRDTARITLESLLSLGYRILPPE